MVVGAARNPFEKNTPANVHKRTSADLITNYFTEGTNPMTEKFSERQTRLAQRVFGPAASVSATAGTIDQAGEIVLHLDGAPIGSGQTFEAALHAAQGLAATMATATQAARVPDMQPLIAAAEVVNRWPAWKQSADLVTA